MVCNKIPLINKIVTTASSYFLLSLQNTKTVQIVIPNTSPRYCCISRKKHLIRYFQRKSCFFSSKKSNVIGGVRCFQKCSHTGLIKTFAWSLLKAAVSDELAAVFKWLRWQWDDTPSRWNVRMWVILMKQRLNKR